MEPDTKAFRLAPMTRGVAALTAVLWLLPVAFVLAGAFAHAAMYLPALALTGIYGWVWLRFRPSGFVVTPTTLDVVWPLKRRCVERASIVDAHIVTGEALKQELGIAVRIGAGGLWGGFGWLWTQKRGNVQMYISRTDRLVWIERRSGRPWLITPERPEDFVKALAG